MKISGVLGLLLIGVLIGVVLVEHLAPAYPYFFCRPRKNGVCEPYPWSKNI